VSGTSGVDGLRRAGEIGNGRGRFVDVDTD
jgi:hypothetical protein